MIATVLWERELDQQGGASVFVVGPDCVVLHERHTRLAGPRGRSVFGDPP
ncbi:hypothetical protein [Streptomyces sp. NPDC059533]